MSKELAYIVRKEVAKRSPWPWTGASNTFYVISFAGKKVAEVWSRKGMVKAYYENGIRAQMAVDYVPVEIEDQQSPTQTITFFLLAHAFDRPTALCWGVQVSRKLAFNYSFRHLYTKAILFDAILEAQKQKVSATP